MTNFKNWRRLVILAFSVLSGLFPVAFLAATVFRMQSDGTLAAPKLTRNFSPVTLIAVDSVGNSLGSIANWFLGRGIERSKGRRGFPANEQALE